MDIELSTFGYHFSVEGTNGGLYSVTLEIAPAQAHQSGPDAAKSALQDMMGVYTALLDELFESDLLDGKKQPSMMDSGHTVNVGYSYKGFWRKAPLLGKEPDIASAIADIFGLADPDVRGGRSPHVSLSASTVFSAHKSGECLHSPMLKLDFQLTHMLNVAVFRFTELLPELDKQDAATEKIAMLNRTLAMDWDRTGRDHFAELKRVKQQN